MILFLWGCSEAQRWTEQIDAGPSSVFQMATSQLTYATAATAASFELTGSCREAESNLLVQLAEDDTELGTGTCSAERAFAITLDLSSLPDGAHELKFLEKTDEGETIAEFEYSVRVDQTPPTLSTVTYQTAGAVDPATVDPADLLTGGLFADFDQATEVSGPFARLIFEFNEEVKLADDFVVGDLNLTNSAFVTAFEDILGVTSTGNKVVVLVFAGTSNSALDPVNPDPLDIDPCTQVQVMIPAGRVTDRYGQAGIQPQQAAFLWIAHPGSPPCP